MIYDNGYFWDWKLFFVNNFVQGFVLQIRANLFYCWFVWYSRQLLLQPIVSCFIYCLIFLSYLSGWCQLWPVMIRNRLILKQVYILLFLVCFLWKLFFFAFLHFQWKSKTCLWSCLKYHHSSWIGWISPQLKMRLQLASCLHFQHKFFVSIKVFTNNINCLLVKVGNQHALGILI